jgi:hypothetical protein
MCILTLATWTAWEAGDARADEAAGAVNEVSVPEVCTPRVNCVVAGLDMAMAWERGERCSGG